MRDGPSMIDPYRTLGLQPGAPMTEVKKAYRRLAKAYHPDSAGEQALPRFLAIHEAYESIRTGRPTPAVRAGGAAAAGRPASEPWRADPDRARAAREQARRRASARPATGAGTGTAGNAGARGGAGARASGAAGGTAGATDPGTGSAGGGSRRGSARAGSSGAGTAGTAGGSGRRRSTRKATMGSTSYDEARDPNDATWGGASWYGPSTGEYWIINPREYADPRKHGPEYQSRARRMAGEGDGTAGPGARRADGALSSETTEPASSEAFERPARTAGGRTRPNASRPNASRPEGWSFGQAVRPQASTAWTPPWQTDSRTLRQERRLRGPGMSPRELVGAASDDPVRRFGIALVAWPPVGLAAAAVIGNLTGCAVYSADCGGTEPLLPWLAQAVILGLLLLVSPVARVLAGGAIGILAALVPLTFFLVAVGGTGAPQAGFALAFLLSIAWLIGVGWGIAEVRRRSRAPSRAGAGPGARPGARA